MYTYGIVILEIKSCNKRVTSSKYSHIVSSFILANTQRKENPKMSIVYHSAPIYSHLQHLAPGQPLRFTPSTAIQNSMNVFINHFCCMSILFVSSVPK